MNCQPGKVDNPKGDTLPCFLRKVFETESLGLDFDRKVLFFEVISGKVLMVKDKAPN